MKRLSFLLGLVLFAGGCAVHYDISTNRGDVIRASTKPILTEEGFYVYKDAAGERQQINRVRVRKIEPVRKGAPQSWSYN